MATFSTYAEVLRPDHVMMKMYRAGVGKQHPGIVLADLLRQTGGAYETTTPLTDKFRGYIREVAELTADDELLRIAELSEVPVSLGNFRQADLPIGHAAATSSAVVSDRWRLGAPVLGATQRPTYSAAGPIWCQCLPSASACSSMRAPRHLRRTRSTSDRGGAGMPPGGIRRHRGVSAGLTSSRENMTTRVSVSTWRQFSSDTGTSESSAILRSSSSAVSSATSRM